MNSIATTGFCVTCEKVIPAEVIEETNTLVFRSYCPCCGEKSSIVEHDAALYRQWESMRRPNRPPESSQNPKQRGCPFDCGLCPNHRQKSCIALIEITDACDLACPVCFADAKGNNHRSMQEIEFMLDACIKSANGKPDIVQISGGEPACHPQLTTILRAAKERPFKYVMLNTNGLAIAEDQLSCSDLKELGNGFEVHLQFDGLDDTVYGELRGRALLEQKMRALERMAEYEIPVTLVSTLRNGVNTRQLGDLLRFALEHPAVRGLNLQCEARFGRNNLGVMTDGRTTQTQIVRELAKQAPDLLNTEDFLPLSCGLACMAYLEKVDGDWKPVPPILAQATQGNPLLTSLEDIDTIASDLCTCRSAELLQEISGRLPINFASMSVAERSQIVQERFFHITIISFLDEHNFDLNRACRECTHIVQPDGRKIPFSTFNTLYRKETYADLV